MRIAPRIIMSLLVTACFLSLASSTYSQGTDLGTIRGTVVDQKGEAVPNAAVQVTDLATNISRDFTTNGEGNYEAAGLKSGNYRVTVTAPGFKTTSINAVLSGSDPVRADARLEVGDASAVVTVTTEAGLIQTETPTISDTINNRQLIELPRDSRDIYQFLYLNPNIVQSADGLDFKFLGAQSYGAAFSLDGQRSNGGIFGGATASQPSLEAISELTVLSNNFTAEYAGIANIRVDTKRGEKDFHGSLFYNNKNSALAAWTIQDKINLANFVPNPARPDYPKPYFNLNETGGSISGPVFGSKKTFFLGAYERRWNIDTVRFAARAILPGQRLLNGDFTQLSNANKGAVPAAVLPLLTPDELANNTILVGTTRRFTTIPQRLLNPTVGKFIQNYFPSSSLNASVDSLGRLTDFAQNVGSRNTRDLVTARIDHDFTSNDKFYAVYNYQRNPSHSGAVQNPFPALGLRTVEQTNHTLSLSFTRAFSTNLINEVRGGFNSQSLFRRSPRTLREFLSSIGFSDTDITAYGAVVGPSALDTPGHTALGITSFGNPLLQNGGRSVNRTLDQKLATFGDTLTWIKGNHSMKGGFDFVRNHGTDGFVANRGNPRGRINYTGGTSSDRFARFLLGLPPNTVQFVEKLRDDLDASNHEYGFFFQDEFRVLPSVTLNLGLRYEIITPFVDSENLLVNFDPDFVDPQTGRKGRFIVPTADVLPLIDPRIINYGVVTADQAGVGPGLVKTDRNNLAPRVGIAWRVTDKTVLRGGYGVFYPTSSAQGIRDALASSPFNHGLTRTATAALPLGGWPGGLTPAGVTPFTGGRLNAFDAAPEANSVPFDLQQPRIEQFNATFERELPWQTGLRVSYLGTRMHGLIGGIDLNMLPPSDVPFGTHGFDDNGDIVICDPSGDIGCDASIDAVRRPFPELGTYLGRYRNFGSGRSHALQIEANRRFSNGLTFNASYTLLDQKGSGFDTGNASLGGPSFNQFHPENDFARDTFVSRHRFVSYGIYELPWGKGRKFASDMPKWADAAFGGFQLSWNMFAKSGTGFTPFWSCDNCDPIFPGNIGSEFVDAVGGFNQPTFRPLVVSGVSQYVKVGDQFFNAQAFLPPPIGADALDNPDLARRNILTGPSTWGVNLGLRKFFKITETARLEVGADLNNAFNHPLRSPNDLNFAELGSFSLDVDQTTGQLLPITNIERNDDFGRIRTSFNQDGIDNRRTVRLRVRLSF
ncbi:MAG TPA: carboxypeptidase-like regulatory domain-containing protein [Pyrinomonadaceae bacterium]|nr:carboxypeptidase-like regulatory domain-containing protein [Pyrinomonadaceae bacterium]